MLDIVPNLDASAIRPEILIHVCIAGLNQTLADACRIYLQHFCPAGHQIQECRSDGSISCDIFIWDYDSVPSLPPASLAAKDAIKIVFVKKGSLSSVRRKHHGADFTYLQSPVTPLALRTILASAIAKWELRHDNGGISSRLKLDRDRILQQLLQTNLKLREYDQDRTNFLARSIHDIRVPLMAVQGYCDLLLAGQVGAIDPEQTGILERMQRSLTRLSGLVQAMLDLGTGSNGTNRLRLEPASIEACVQQAVYEILPFIEKKQISLNMEVEAPDATLAFDSGQIEQVLVNLLDNACKFTPKGGAITIRGRSIGSQESGKVGLLEATAGYRIDITDTGRGIDPDHIEHIFDEHTSFGDPTERSGSGLGLAICRMIIDSHNGRIWAEPEADGAHFSFVLPLVRSFHESYLSHAAISTI